MKCEFAKWKQDKDQILQVENACFPKNMASDEDDLADTFKDRKSLCLVLKDKDEIIGYISSAPLEKRSYKDYDGVKQDANYKKHNTLYVESIAIIPRYRGIKSLYLLFQTFINEAKKQNYKFLTHHTRTDNDLADVVMKKLNAELVSKHHNWFGWGETFQYIRVIL